MDARDLAGATWRKSSRSGGSGECVEVAAVRHGVAVRDSKDPDGAQLHLDRLAWRKFLAMAKDDQLNQLGC
jgi:hypothetical protein